MNLSKLQISVVGAMVIAGVMASLMIQQRAEVKIREQDEALRHRENQLAELAGEHERLLNVVVQLTSSPRDARLRELQGLRTEAEGLRKQTSELERKLEQGSQLRKALVASTYPSYPEEYHKQRDEMTAGKRKDAGALSRAIYDYWSKHQYEFPTSLDQLAPYLQKEHLSLTGTNDFEMLYAGPLDGLTNFPTQVVAVVRERQAWLAPSGKRARVYGMLTIPPKIVESDDNFQSWEAEHIIAPPDARQ